MAATSRLVVLMDPTQKARLEAQAKADNVSVGEVVRRRLGSARDPGEEAFLEALIELGDRIDRLQARVAANDAAEARAKASEADERARIQAEVEAWYQAAERVPREVEVQSGALGEHP